MKWKKLYDNFWDAFWTIFSTILFFGWGYFIYKLSAGFDLSVKVGLVTGSYLLVFLTCKAFSHPGVGAIPVKIVYIERDIYDR